MHVQTGYLTDLNWCTHVLQNKRFLSASYWSQSNCFNHRGWNTLEFTRIGFTFFLGRLIRGYCLLRLRIGFAFLICRKREANAVRVTEWRTTEIVFARKFENVWSLIKNGLIKRIHFLMRLMPKQSIEMRKQSIEIWLVNTLHLFHWYTQVPRKLSVINDLRWISTNLFYAEKPMGGFYRLTDTCVISSAICMDKIACRSFVATRFYTSVKH